jgi:hypothetical protein
MQCFHYALGNWNTIDLEWNTAMTDIRQNIPSKYKELPGFKNGVYDDAVLRFAIALSEILGLDGFKDGVTDDNGIGFFCSNF